MICSPPMHCCFSSLVCFLTGRYAREACAECIALNRGWYLYPRHDRDGRGLCVDHVYDFHSGQVDYRLKKLCENPQPVSAQDLFDLLVIEAALDQLASEVTSM
jgi:hypothetical protein